MSGYKGVLDGITVLDISEVFQAPLAAQALGDLGARVIKIERPGSGELLRKMDAYAVENGKLSAYYAGANRNKSSIVLDLKTAAGQDIVRELVLTADVLVHNYRPGVMERLGLGFEQLSAINPRLVFAIATGYGETGPLADRPGQDMVAQSLSGIAATNGEGGASPALISTPMIDFASGMILAQGVLAALFERKRSGLGQKVSVCLLDTAVAMQGLEAASLLNYGRKTHWRNQGLNFVFQTAEGWLTVLGFFRENPLRLLCNALEIEDLSQREEYSTLSKQVAKKEAIFDIVQKEIAKYTTDEALARLQKQDILCAPVLTLAEALKHPQVSHNQMISTVDVDGQQPMTVIANPLKLSRTPPRVYRGPARLGADTFDVLREQGISKIKVDNANAEKTFGAGLPTSAMKTGGAS